MMEAATAEVYSWPFTFRVSWAQIRRNNETFLQERVAGQKGWSEFGPMCPVAVDGLVRERIAYYRALADRHIDPRQMHAGAMR